MIIVKARMKILINLLLGLFYLWYIFHPSNVQAEKQESEEANVLIVFSADNNNITENERLLDMYISHFTSTIAVVNSKEVVASDLSDVTHLFYYGRKEEKLPGALLQLFQSYSETFIAIGHNVKQLSSHFSDIKVEETVSVSEVFRTQIEEQSIKGDGYPIMNVKVADNAKGQVILSAKQNEQVYPLLLKENNAYYYATTNLFPPYANYFADILHDVFEMSHENNNQSYIRLEDIHPRVDGDNVMEIAMFLEKRNIPYLVAVTPVYVNPSTKEEFHLSENIELVKALTYMQDHGGSIILHGYTDQSDKSETGSGFEFWDKEKNTPVYQNANQELAYLEERLKKGIQTLVDNGLYPLAFEAPHYALSQNGYKGVADYFSTYVGQVQLTDEDWQVMTESPNITYPTFLDGMMLLPETIRYVRYNDPLSIEEMKKSIEYTSVVRDGVISAFYHPFLGLDDLVKLVDEIETIQNIKWLDLKELNNSVQTKTISIRTNNGEISVEKLLGDRGVRDSKESKPIETYNYLSWILIGAGAVVLMVLLSLFLFRKSRKS